MSTAATLPHWDVSEIFPGLESPEFLAACDQNIQAIQDLTALFDANGIDKHDPAPLDEATVALFEQVLDAYNTTFQQAVLLRGYIYSFVSVNTRDDLAQARSSTMQQHFAKLSLLNTRLTAWLGSLDTEALIARSAVAQAHAFALRQASVRAQHLMDPALEALTSELQLTGGSAWGKLHQTFTSQISAPVELDGQVQELPITAIRNLAFNPDRAVRKRAYTAEIEAWRRASVPIAAALNGVKGEVLTLGKRRGWASPLDQAVFNNSIDRATLDAMMQAAHESFPDFRRYLHAKARALGVPALAWYDLFAPVGTSEAAWPYERGTDFILQQFGSYSPRLRGLAERAFSNSWVDAEPRDGKVGGAFCMGLRPGESRILTNYEPTFMAVSTLAHELGHAYHNLNLAERTPLQRSTPMTLAETASTFCETIIVQAALGDASPAEQLQILEASLQDSCQVVVDITSRFLFEQAVFERRGERELSADEFCTLMLDAQRQTYGDGLDQEQLHPYMWAVKGHYYGPLFYNYPYMFGLLFGLGLYERYRHDPDTFTASYDDLLSSTGLDDAATLAARFGIDTRSPDFWRSSLNVIRHDIDLFEKLVDGQ
ncbi:MAG: M3 family oligoendopeptidase [Roseiflexaceae bacterium]